MKKIKYVSIKYLLSQVLQYLVCILPLVILLIKNWDIYYQFNQENNTSTTFGLIGILVMLGLCLLKQSAILKGNFAIVFMWVFTITLYCLRFIINDLVSIMFCASIGLSLGAIVKNTIVKRYARLRDKVETSVINNYGMEQVLTNVFKNSGRV